MWERLLDRFLRGMFVADQIRVTYPSGNTVVYGPDTGKNVGLTIKDARTLRELCLQPELAMGEAYMDARITLDDTTLDDLMEALIRNRDAGQLSTWLRATDWARYFMRSIIQRNAPGRSKQNVAHHYDISDDLYRLFLDADMQYSCAYFPTDDTSLEDAQIAKKALIARKLCLEPDMHVLDIGCGWGGMALTLARDHGVRVTGITLSENQLATARKRAEAEGLADRVTFRLQDYRHEKATYDRIVSVGMLEHVGVPNYGTYFDKVAELLAPDGVALIHTIGRSAPPMSHSQWINKYIFPGGYVPSLSELAPALESSGLWQTDIEIWRLHYAKTLRHWRQRFEANVDQIRGMYDDRFVRMFRYYLTVCILAFEHQAQAVYHVQLAHRRDAVPLTRDYLYPFKEQSQTQSTSRAAE
ncbi:MAG: class I SAM-dependent methyltransferase [Rhodobacteraceae bacterium]|nr:class I SAM-dependent methyltransferase [Paracoccaceae bacterium]